MRYLLLSAELSKTRLESAEMRRKISKMKNEKKNWDDLRVIADLDQRFRKEKLRLTYTEIENKLIKNHELDPLSPIPCWLAFSC